MSEIQEIDSPIATSEGNINNSNSTSVPDEGETMKTSSNEKDSEIQKSECIEEPKSRIAKHKDIETVPSDDTTKMENKSSKRDEIVVTAEPPTSPMTNTPDRNKAGECNLLPVLVERLRSALEQSCSSPSVVTTAIAVRPDDTGINSEDELRVWASGLSNSMEQERDKLGSNDFQNPRGLKLDLKFLEDLLLSDIQTALGRLQETLVRVDIGTLTRYSSTLDPTNKLNLLKLISSLLASLKIPEDSIVKPVKTLKNSSSGVARRRRADRHTIAITSDELARARKWLDDKSVLSTVPDSTCDVKRSQLEIVTVRNLESDNRREKSVSVDKESTMDRLECDEKQYPMVPEKYMKDALNQQQSLQNKTVKDTARETIYQESGNITSGCKIGDLSYKDDNTIINDEYGLSASSLYNRSNTQTKSNKYLAKKSKIKRANTIDIPNYLKLQAESLTNGNGAGALRRPINIGDKYSYNGGNVVPSFEPKTENDRKFLALINKNNDASTITATSSLPFKSFNYRQISSDADKNWNSRFSNIKTTFDKRTNGREENIANKSNEIVVGSLRLPCKQKSPGFSHAPTSPFQKIEKPSRDEMIPGFLKPGYLPKNGSALRAKVKMFDQENVESTVSPDLSPLPTRTHPKHQSNGKKLFFNDSDQQSSKDNGNINYHTFCKQFAPFVTKNQTDHPKSGPWSNDSGNLGKKTRLQDGTREKLKLAEEWSRDEKVPVAYRSTDLYENNARQEKPRNRKLYESYDVRPTENGTNSQDIVAYPFEINYQKRGSFDKNNRDVSSDKANIGENVQQQSSSPLSSLQYIKSILPSTKNPSPPPRDISLTQNVAVQTQRTEPFRPIYTSDNLVNNPISDESSIFRRLNPSSKDIATRQTRNLPRDEVRRNSDHHDDSRTGSSRQYHDNYQRASCQRDPDSSLYTSNRNPPSQGRHTLPQNPTGHVSHQVNRYPPIMDYESQYYPGIEQPAVLPPQIALPSISKHQREQTDRYEDNQGKSYEDKNRGVRNYPIYSDNDFHRDAHNLINVQTDRNVEIDPRDFHENSTVDQFAGSLIDSSSLSNPADNYSHVEAKSYGDDGELANISADPSFVEDENIQNQDISTTEGVVTRYACAIATVSPVPESPTISSSSSPPKDTRDIVTSDVVHENLQSTKPADEPEIPYVSTPFYRDERSHEREAASIDQVMRHNLLQQNLIRQLQRDQSEVSNSPRRMSQETSYGEESTMCKYRYPIKSDVEQLPTVSRNIFQKSCVDETMRDVAGQQSQFTDQPNRNVETVIESNNTQDKINIFEERNNSMKINHHRFKPLSIPHRDRATFVTPKINVVSPSKVFKPSFKGDANSRASNIGTIELPRKITSSVDSSDEYLMSCANKPSRSIVLSKSESWHQLAFSKNTLQVPQAQPCALLKPPKPKSPSSLKLSKQYEASSSSDGIRKMEEKIQRYFQGTGPTGQNDSPIQAQKDNKSKRNFNYRKSQGSLMRSQTMPHIYDDSTDVDKAFDSLFKEATRADNRC